VNLPPKDKFQLYLLIGQSNMAGRGLLDEQSSRPHPRALAFTRDNAWAPAVEPLHSDKSKAGAGLAHTFATAMAEHDPSTTIGLIPCAFGGSALSTWEFGGEHVVRALERCGAAMRDGTLAGILWHQGETDAMDENLTRTYAQRLDRMIADLRANLGSPDVPFVAGEILHFMYDLPEYPGAARINEALRNLPRRVPRTACVSAAGILTHRGDKVHFDTAGLRELGRRYAKEMISLVR
jgi:hypothetical protein